MENRTEKLINDFVNDSINIVWRYIYTYFNILFRPNQTTHRIFSLQDEELMKPIAFLVSNLFISQLVQSLVFKVNSDMQRESKISEFFISGNYFKLLTVNSLSVLIGMLVFITFLCKYSFGKDYLKNFPKLVNIFSYASVIYLPFCILKTIVNRSTGDMFKTIWLSLLSSRIPNFNPITMLVSAVGCSLLIFFILWWGRLIYINLGYCLTLISSKRRAWFCIKSFIAVYVTKFIVYGLIYLYLATPFFLSSYKLFRIEEYIKDDTINFHEIYSLSIRLSDFDNFSPFIKSYIYFVHTLSEIVFWNLDPEMNYLNKAVYEIKNKKYIETYDILKSFVDKMMEDKSNPKRILYSGISKRLEEIKTLQSSQEYFEGTQNIELRLDFNIVPISIFP